MATYCRCCGRRVLRNQQSGLCHVHRLNPPHSQYHMGRAWGGHEIEDACVCAKEPCGLVGEPNPECEQHGHRFARTMRQGHFAHECPWNLVRRHG